MTTREASIFGCLCDTVVAPRPALPPVAETDAVVFFDHWLSRSPRANRLAFRALLYAVELAPLLLGARRRLRTLPEDERAAVLRRAEAGSPPRVGHALELLEGIALLSYYGDARIMGRLGYDAAERVRRGRALRTVEARP